jgi:hypothetical protein
MRIAHELPVDFVEEDVVSLQRDDIAITSAPKRSRRKQNILAKADARDGVRVLRVHPLE